MKLKICILAPLRHTNPQPDVTVVCIEMCVDVVTCR